MITSASPFIARLLFDCTCCLANGMAQWNANLIWPDKYYYQDVAKECQGEDNEAHFHIIQNGKEGFAVHEDVVQDAPELAQPFAYIRPRRRRRSGRSGRPYPVVQDAPVPSMMQEAPVTEHEAKQQAQVAEGAEQQPEEQQPDAPAPEHEAKQQAQGSEAAEEEAVPLSQWAVPNAAVLLPLQDPQQDEEQWPDDQELAQALIMLHSRLEMS